MNLTDKCSESDITKPCDEKQKPTPAGRMVEQPPGPSAPASLSDVRHVAEELRECLIENSLQSSQGRLLRVDEKLNLELSDDFNSLFDLARCLVESLPDTVKARIKTLIWGLIPGGEGAKTIATGFPKWVLEGGPELDGGRHPSWNVAALTRDPGRFARICDGLDRIADPREAAQLKNAREEAGETLAWLKRLGDPGKLPAAYVEPLRGRMAKVILAPDGPKALPSADQEAAFRELCEIQGKLSEHPSNCELDAGTMQWIRVALGLIAGEGFVLPPGGKKSKDAKRRNRSKRGTPTVKMMQAYEANKAGLPLRAIAKNLKVSHETVRRWVQFTGEYLGDNARSKRANQTLPTDRRGGEAV